MTLALPAPPRDQPRHLLSLGALLGGVSTLVVAGTVVASYIHTRSVAPAWPPRGVRIDNYLGVVITITAVMSSWLVEWAAAAARDAQRRQALGALALSALLGFSLVNGIWYFGARLGFGVNDHAYAVLTYALVGIGCGAAVVATVLVVAAMAKVAGRQMDRDSEVVRAVCWYWHSAIATWLVVYFTLFVFR